VSAVLSPSLIDEQAVWAALAEVPDPEIPAVSVVDLGIVHRVNVEPDAIRVEILPTFVGCPAVEMMRSAIVDRLAGLAPRIEVDVTFAVPWTSDRITPEGRQRLAASGFAPPTAAAGSDAPIQLGLAVTCPYCGSRRTVMENAFGPTLCRSIYYCTDCRQPFEQFKAV
jgi:ring-1,2-phenylacetyl-CoA epoxidase subunit PaaD